MTVCSDLPKPCTSSDQVFAFRFHSLLTTAPEILVTVNIGYVCGRGRWQVAATWGWPWCNDVCVCWLARYLLGAALNALKRHHRRKFYRHSAVSADRYFPPPVYLLQRGAMSPRPICIDSLNTKNMPAGRYTQYTLCPRTKRPECFVI